MSIEAGEIFDQHLSRRHEAKIKLESALERQLDANGKLQSFFAKLAVKRAEKAVLTGEAKILELPNSSLEFESDNDLRAYH